MKRLTQMLLFAALALLLRADDIVVKEIGGVPVIRTRIHYRGNFVEAHILLDLGSTLPMVIHEKALGGLELSPLIAEGQEVAITFNGNASWKEIPLHVEERVPLLEKLTRDYAQALGEVPVVAIVGLPAIKSNVVELDLRKGLLRTLGLASDEAQAKEMDYEAKPYGIILNGRGPTQAPAKVQLSLSSEDSRLDLSWLTAARKAGKPANVLEVGDLRFSDQTPFRFESLEGLVPGPVDAVIGVGAVRNFMLTLWPKRGKIAFLPHPPVPFPQAEQDYFFALADRNPEGVATFISGRSPGPLLDEACLSLWQLRLDDPASTTAQLKTVLETISVKYWTLRSTAALALIADQLEGSRRPDKETLVMFALERAMQQSDKALDQTAAQAVHLRFGKRALAKGELQQARRHLLSAAFGLPKNGECNFWLGELYREMGKSSRAWSRYFQAILDPKMYLPPLKALLLEKALARLDDLNRDPAFRKTFNMVVAEQYMAGRLSDVEFHAPSRYKQVKDLFPGHVKLVEFFTNATDPTTGGMQLAFQSLEAYFEGEVALITYHLNDPMHSEVARHRLDFYKGKGAPLAVFDGTAALNQNPSRAKILSENALANYPSFRDACQFEKAAPDTGWTLEARLAQEGMKVSGTITAAGQGATDKLRLHAILCERSVMAVEDSMVFFHHVVAREALTPPDGLDLKNALETPFSFAVDAEQMRQALEKRLNAAGRPGGRSKPTYVDPNKLLVVVFVQQHETRRILAAKTFSLPQEEEAL